MKRITGIAIATAGLLGSCYVGNVGAYEVEAPLPALNPNEAYGFCIDNAKASVNAQADMYALTAACMLGYSQFVYGVTPEDMKAQSDEIIASAKPVHRKTYLALESAKLYGYAAGWKGAGVNK